MEELKKKVDLSFKNLCGGFHNHPGMIEQILRECCNDWESRSAGATPTSSQLDMDMHVRQYLPQCQLRIGDDDVDPATKGQEEENMIEKRVCSVGVYMYCLEVCSVGVYMYCLEVCSVGVYM